jgi:hypothetical protein
MARAIFWATIWVLSIMKQPDYKIVVGILNAAASWGPQPKYRRYPVGKYDHFPNAVHLICIGTGQSFSSIMGS